MHENAIPQYKNKQNLADGVCFLEKVITFTLKMFHLLIVTAAATYRKLNKIAIIQPVLRYAGWAFLFQIITFTHLNQTAMRANFESRFMQVALSGGSQMTNVELTAEFECFQHEVRNLLMSDNGYLVIDFTLRDLLAQFDGIVRCKKK